MTEHANRARILDVREERKAASRFEFREDSAGDFVLEGYAATFTPYDVYGGPDRGGWVETLALTAFDVTLGERPDVQLLVNHEGLPLARTIAGTMDLSRDSHGLKVLARLDRSDPDVQSLAPKLKPQRNGRSNMDEMSFAFRVKDQLWDDNYTNRTITEVSLHKGDVSVVNYGMNPGTRAALQQGVDALASLSHKELVELRRLDPDLVHRAELALASLPDRRAWQSNEVHDLTKGRCARCEEARAKTPKAYSGVSNFADPGYLDSSGNPAKGGNGVKRYPIDAAHVKAAWSYINMPKNQKGYTAGQLASIKSKIRAAMKEAGHDVSDDSKGAASLRPVSQSGPSGVSHYDMVRNTDGGTTMIAVLYDGSRTPLPSAPASPMTQGSRPAPGDARLGGMFPYVWPGPGVRVSDQRDDAEACDDPDCDNPDHNHEGRAFGGKKAPPFKKGGGKADDGDDEDDNEQGRGFVDAQDAMADYDGQDAEGALDDQQDDDEDEHEESVGNELLGQGPINVTRMLNEFRKSNEIPDIRSVSEGLAYLKRA
jgi:HK97 family phage prohead protease